MEQTDGPVAVSLMDTNKMPPRISHQQSEVLAAVIKDELTKPFQIEDRPR